jgi:hypothetical protein
VRVSRQQVTIYNQEHAMGPSNPAPDFKAEQDTNGLGVQDVERLEGIDCSLDGTQYEAEWFHRCMHTVVRQIML